MGGIICTSRRTGPGPETGARAGVVVSALALAAAAGCGGTSANVLEKIDNGTPPSSNLRVDVFLVRSVTTCAVGIPCLRSLDECFYVADANGPRIAFSTDALSFVRPGDPRIQTAPQAQCFKMTMDDAQVASAAQLMSDLRQKVFQFSGKDINLDIRTHQIAALEAPFESFYTGLFLDPRPLRPLALPLLGSDTDFVYAMTGFDDPETGLRPKMEPCAGTNGFGVGVLGASPYTWLGLSDQCDLPRVLLRSWMIQLHISRRDVGEFADLYRGNYPACGAAAADPSLWFPRYYDCTSDPDWLACGRFGACPDEEAYFAHVLGKHWHRGEAFNGNYCANGRLDFDETSVDMGGACDLIAR